MWFQCHLIVHFAMQSTHIHITCELNHWKAYVIVSTYFRRNCSFFLFLFFSFYKVYIPIHRDGTDGQATVYWSLKPSGFNSKAVTLDDIGPFNGSVVFLSGQSDTTINITIHPDDIPEMNEMVTLSLDR